MCDSGKIWTSLCSSANEDNLTPRSSLDFPLKIIVSECLFILVLDFKILSFQIKSSEIYGLMLDKLY